MKEDRLYLIHIIECIEKVENYTADDKDAFLNNPVVQDAVLRNLQIMAESTQRLSDELKDNHPDIDWRGIAGFRNVLTHGYLGININRVWDIVERLLPKLKTEVETILKDLGE